MNILILILIDFGFVFMENMRGDMFSFNK